MDGDAILVGFASSSGPEWLKDIVPKVGLRLKVYSALRSLHLQSKVRHVTHCILKIRMFLLFLFQVTKLSQVKAAMNQLYIYYNIGC